MITTYKIFYDKIHLIESMRKYRSQMPSKWYRNLIKIICALFLFCLFIFGIYVKVVFASIVGGFFLVLLFVGPKLDEIILVYRSNKSPFFNNNASITISIDGIKCEDKVASTNLNWSAVTKIIHFSEGLLIFTGPQVFYWCPNNAIEEGNLNHVISLAKENSIEIKYT